jgi:membrane protein required for colicin V production
MNRTMNILDLLFITILFFSLFFGIFRGLVREVLSLLFLVAALVSAFFYYKETGLLLSNLIRNRDLADFAGFLLVLILVAGVGFLLARLLSKYLVVGPLKGIDRLLGAVFGLLRGMLLSGLVIYSFLAFPLNRELLIRSQLAPFLTKVIVAGIHVLPPSLRDRLRIIKAHDQQENSRNSRTV